MEENKIVKTEELRRLRDSMMSPYVAQDWELVADFPTERRITFKRERKANGWLVFLGLCFYILPGIAYYIWVKSSPEKKTLMY